MQAFDQLYEILDGVKADVVKAEEGNKAAARRIRTTMQKLKQTAQEVRLATYNIVAEES